MGDIIHQCHCFTSMGLQLGYSGFLMMRNIDLSGEHITCIYCGLSVKINMRGKPHGMRYYCTHMHEDHGRILFAFFFCVRAWSARTRIPQLELHGWQGHYTGQYGRSEISLLYLWYALNFYIRGTNKKQRAQKFQKNSFFTFSIIL